MKIKQNGETVKQLSNPSSTGGLGIHFENRIQASFVVLMLAGGFAPCLCSWPIVKIKLQGKYQGFETDDLIVYTEQPGTEKKAKLLGQIKHFISITNGDKEFCEVIQAAWADFNNKSLFNEKTDAIALICGPLSATDTNDVRLLLNQAKHSENVDDFFTRIQKAKFTSNKQRNKFEIFKSQLKVANKNIELTNDELWRFLKSFHLLIYDLDIQGVASSMLYTILGHHLTTNTNALWTQILDHVERENENAGAITIDSIPEDIKTQFKPQPIEVIPENLVKNTCLQHQDWNLHRYAKELTIANLIGSWNENSESDKLIISILAGEDYKTWIQKIREIIQESESPIILKNGIWNIKNRKELWKSLSLRIFDETLDKFKACITSVLTEIDPKFELDKEKRFASNIYGKILKHSDTLRKGLAESLALIGCYPDILTNCSRNKSKNIVSIVIKEILKSTNWMLWASLNNLLPIIAEADPETFLSSVEIALRNTPTPFSELFAQEGDGIIGSNYITGLLWALENIAWEEQYLVQTTVVLGELAQIDPGGRWSNRPSNSLIEIFLPWHPQTTASIEKRKVAIKTINKEMPDVAWPLLMNLLPKSHQIASGCSKPLFRKSISDDWTGKVTNKEYYEQTSYYANFLVEQAKDNISKLSKIVDNLDNLPKAAFDKLLKYLSADSVLSVPEDDRLELWQHLTKFILHHERYSYTEWALDSTLIAKIKKVANKLEPQNPIHLHSRLFDDSSFDLFVENGNWEEQSKILEDHRQSALKAILEYGGNEALFKLIENVEYPTDIGRVLGNIGNDSLDRVIIPDLLISANRKFELFANNYVQSRWRQLGWQWADSIEFEGWSIPQIASYFSYLPFIADTWKRVSKTLSDSDFEYWSKVNVNPYHAKDELDFAIDKLIEYQRPYAALGCIHKNLNDKKTLNTKKAVQALIDAISSTEPAYSKNTYDVLEIIKALQEDSSATSEDLFQVEWAYLSWLDGENRGVRPKFIEKQLSTDPNFFFEIISKAYRSEKITKEEYKPTPDDQKIALHIYDLLKEWRRPPGLQDDGTFNESNFTKWINEVVNMCTESGHLDVALVCIGNVLFYCPPDTDGFWINRVVADTLNQKEFEKMRNGFHSEILNSRGVYCVDPSAKPEKEFALKYKKQAEDTENAGYHRLANTLRSISEFYDKEAERILEDNKSRTD